RRGSRIVGPKGADGDAVSVAPVLVGIMRPFTGSRRWRQRLCGSTWPITLPRPASRTADGWRRYEAQQGRSKRNEDRQHERPSAAVAPSRPLSPRQPVAGSAVGTAGRSWREPRRPIDAGRGWSRQRARIAEDLYVGIHASRNVASPRLDVVGFPPQYQDRRAAMDRPRDGPQTTPHRGRIMAQETIVFAQGIEMPPHIQALAQSLKPAEFALRALPSTAKPEEIAVAMRDAEYLVGFLRFQPDEAYLEAKRLKLVQVLSAGYDAVNIAGARKAGIPICQNGGANSVAVSEHAVLLILS